MYNAKEKHNNSRSINNIEHLPECELCYEASLLSCKCSSKPDPFRGSTTFKSAARFSIIHLAKFAAARCSIHWSKVTRICFPKESARFSEASSRSCSEIIEASSKNSNGGMDGSRINGLRARGHVQCDAFRHGQDQPELTENISIVQLLLHAILAFFFVWAMLILVMSL